MGVFGRLFGKKSATQYSKQDIEIIGASATRVVEILNESLVIAEKSCEPDTKLSRLQVAKDKLEEIQEIERKYSFITISNSNEIEKKILKIEAGFAKSNLREICEDNENGECLEKQGNIKEAIGVYECSVSKKVDTPFPYRRLAILYRKAKQKEEEIRVLNTAIANIPKSNSKHYAWFDDRLSKITSK